MQHISYHDFDVSLLSMDISMYSFKYLQPKVKLQ